MPNNFSGSATGTTTGSSSLLALTPSNNLRQLILNDTQQIRHTETGLLNWTILSATVEKTDPAGTITSFSPGIESGTPALAQSMWFNLHPVIAGVYKFKWTFTASDGEVYDRVEFWIVNFMDVYTHVQTQLQKPSASLPMYDVALQFTLLMRLLYQSYPTLPQYLALTGDDQLYMDMGLGYLVADRIRLYKPSTVPHTPLIRIKEQTSEFGFSAPAAVKNAGNVDEGGLANEGIALLKRIGAIKEFYDNLRTGNNAFHVFRVDGPSRQSVANGYQPTMYSVVANMLATQVDLGSQFNWDYWSNW